MKEKTNALFLFAALILFLYTSFFMFVSLNLVNYKGVGEITGMVTNASSGYVNLSISSAVSIDLTVKAVDFGTGFVTMGCNNCTVDTQGGSTAACCSDFSTSQVGLVIENTGNEYLQVIANFSKNASEFIRGDDSINEFKMLVVQNESPGSSDSCNTLGSTWASAYADVPSVKWAGAAEVCNVLSPNEANDTIRIHINITIPDNADSGDKNCSVTITGTGL